MGVAAEPRLIIPAKKLIFHVGLSVTKIGLNGGYDPLAACTPTPCRGSVDTARGSAGQRAENCAGWLLSGRITEPRLGIGLVGSMPAGYGVRLAWRGGHHAASLRQPKGTWIMALR
jgi:hypothetical protein